MTPYDPPPAKYRDFYRYVPDTAFVVGEDLYDTSTGERIEIPDTCECDQDFTCYFPPCQDYKANLHDEYAYSQGKTPNQMRREIRETQRRARLELLRDRILLIDREGHIREVEIPEAEDQLASLRSQYQQPTLVPQFGMLNQMPAIYWVGVGPTYNHAASSILGKPVYGDVLVANFNLRTAESELFHHFLIDLEERQPPAPDFGR